MSLIADRIDYTNKTYCDKCPPKGRKKLSSGIAHILVDNTGNEYHCGPYCAEKYASNSIKNIPNKTIEHSEHERGDSTSSDPNHTKTSFEDVEKDARTYLMLRYDLRNVIKENATLTEYYNRKNNLSKDNIWHIHNIRNKSNGLYTLISTKRVYEFIYKAQLIISNNDNEKKKSILKSSLKKFYEYQKLTQKQKLACENYLNLNLDFVSVFE